VRRATHLPASWDNVSTGERPVCLPGSCVLQVSRVDKIPKPKPKKVPPPKPDAAANDTKANDTQAEEASGKKPCTTSCRPLWEKQLGSTPLLFSTLVPNNSASVEEPPREGSLHPCLPVPSVAPSMLYPNQGRLPPEVPHSL